MKIEIIIFSAVWATSSVSCATFQSRDTTALDDNENYQLHVYKRKSSNDSSIIYGQLIGIVDKLPLEIGVVRVKNDIIRTDTIGRYWWKPKPGKYEIVGRSIGYGDVKIDKLTISKGDSIELNFQLPPGPPITHKMP